MSQGGNPPGQSAELIIVKTACSAAPGNSAVVPTRLQTSDRLGRRGAFVEEAPFAGIVNCNSAHRQAGRGWLAHINLQLTPVINI